MTRKIAIISDHASPLAELGTVDSGGQNVYVGQVARRLAELGYKVDVFTRRDSPVQPEIVPWENGVRIIHVPAGPAQYMRKEELLDHMQEFTDYMIQFCSRAAEPYHIVHANFWMSGLVAADLKQALGIPFLITFHALGLVRRQHQGDADGFPEERFEIERRIVAEADRIIAECPQDEDDLIQLYHADPDKIFIVPCGFDQDELWQMDKTLSRKVLHLSPKEFIILQLGRMVPRKGVDNVIQGFARLVKGSKIPARLLVIGGESDDPDPEKTPEIGRLQSIAAEEGVSDRVTFVGRRGREALKHYYSAADLFVSTPWYEPFGITPVEAMACGTPVIGSNVGGIKYTVIDGATGFLVPPHDPDALAERIAQLLGDPDLLEQMSHAAVQRANELFTWERVATSIADIIEQVLASVLPVTRLDVNPINVVKQGFLDAIQTLTASQELLCGPILSAAQSLTTSLANGGKVMVAGNGGSAADAQHFATEFIGRFKLDGRRALPVFALTADSAFITAWANDFCYDTVFSRQIEAFGQPGDVLVGISTSGRSQNLLEAFTTARQRKITTIAVLGGDGGMLLPLADIALVVPASDTARIQEVHILALHLLCELVEGHFVSEQYIVSDSLLAPSNSGVRSLWGIQQAPQLSLAIEGSTNLGDLPLNYKDPTSLGSKGSNRSENKKNGR
jgi:phosphoheptose isomerase